METISQEQVSNNNTTFDPKEEEYIISLSDKEKKAYLIAKEHLFSSFSLKKSNGFLEFLEKINKN